MKNENNEVNSNIKEKYSIKYAYVINNIVK